MRSNSRSQPRHGDRRQDKGEAKKRKNNKHTTDMTGRKLQLAQKTEQNLIQRWQELPHLFEVFSVRYDDRLEREAMERSCQFASTTSRAKQTESPGAT